MTHTNLTCSILTSNTILAIENALNNIVRPPGHHLGTWGAAQASNTDDEDMA